MSISKQTYVGYNDIDSLDKFKDSHINTNINPHQDVINFAKEYSENIFGNINKRLVNCAFDAYSCKDYYKFGGVDVHSMLLKNHKATNCFKNRSLLGLVNYLYYTDGIEFLLTLNNDSKSKLSKVFSNEAVNIALDSMYLDDSGFSFIADLLETTKSHPYISEQDSSTKHVEIPKETIDKFTHTAPEKDNYFSSTADDVLGLDFYAELLILRKNLSSFSVISTHNNEIEIIKKIKKSLDDKCEQTVDLKYDIENNASFLIEQSTELSSKCSSSNSEPFKNLVNSYKKYAYQYNHLSTDEFSKTSYQLNNIYSKKIKKIGNDNKTYINNMFFDDEYKTKNTSSGDSTNENAISYFLNHSDFLYMKELDYKNLEAFVRRSARRKPATDNRKAMFLIYLILYIGSKSKAALTSKEIKELFKKISDSKWKHSPSEKTKIFSLAFNFVKNEDNPFTDVINDDEFNTSQKDMKEIRNLLERDAKKILEDLKKIVYVSYDGKSNVGIYSFFQALADIAYELSSPMTFDVDFEADDILDNFIASFLNACIDGLEIQTTVLIFDFIFNFGFWIDGEYYTLNKINNILKTLNLVIDTSKDSAGLKEMVKNKKKLAMNSALYYEYKKLGFLAFDETLDILSPQDNSFKSKYHFNKSTIGFDELQYILKIHNSSVSPGDLDKIHEIFFSELTPLISKAMFVFNTNKHKLSGMNEALYKSGKGYIVIENYVNELTSNNSLFDTAIRFNYSSNDNPYYDYLRQLKLSITEYIFNAKDNEKKIVSQLSSAIDDNKIIDWAMKIIPTYELIANTFGFKGLDHIKTLDGFVTSLLNLMNTLMDLTFEKWKSEVKTTVKTRTIKLIDRERYYYIQSFPVLIDWMMIQVEQIFESVFNFDPNGRDTFIDEKKLILNLKNELGYMTSVQKKKTEEDIKKILNNTGDLTTEEVNNLSDKLVNAETINFDMFNELKDSTKSKLIKSFNTLFN